MNITKVCYTSNTYVEHIVTQIYSIQCKNIYVGGGVGVVISVGICH